MRKSLWLIIVRLVALIALFGFPNFALAAAEDVSASPDPNTGSILGNRLHLSSSTIGNLATLGVGQDEEIGIGKALVAASWEDSRRIAISGSVVVTNVMGVTVNPTAWTVKIGTPVTLTAFTTPTTAINKVVNWTSSDTSVATVSIRGKITPLTVGATTITATTADGGYTGTCSVTVIQPVTSATLGTRSTILKIGDPDLPLTATVAPADATNPNVVWASSSPSVATVSPSGVVHAVSSGTVLITASSAQNPAKLARCIVTVPVPVTGVRVSLPSLTAKVGTTVRVSAVFTPTNASIKTVAWGSSNAAIATVSTAGLITPLAVGSATITVTSADGGYTETCVVTVIQPVTGVFLDSRSATLSVGDPDLTLSATVSPSDATNSNIVWTSSNRSVATVSSSGVVHALSRGTVLITAASAQNPAKLARCFVSVPG